MRTTADSRNVRVARYARISQDREGAGVKVEDQLLDEERYCEPRGWEIVATFSDNDTSAYRGRKRRGYQALCDAIAAGQVDAVIVTHLDRLFRSNLELEEFIKLIEQTGAKVYSIQGADYDLSTSDGQFMARIVGAAARKESADKSRRIKNKQVKVAEAGKFHGGGRRPFGYGGAPLLDQHGNPKLRADGTPMPDHRVVNEPEAALIREAARRVLEGETTWAILRDWTARGVPTTGGGPWNNRSLNQILTSARVAGKRSHKGAIVTKKNEDGTPVVTKDGEPVYVEAEWPAILDEETWAGCRAILGGRSQPVGKRPTYLLSGLVFCPCGGKMRSQSIRGRRRYTCVSGPGGGCGKVSRDAERLERFVAGWVVSLAAVLGHGRRSNQKPSPKVTGLEARLDRLDEEYAVEDRWTRDQYDRLRAQLETALADARDQAGETVVAKTRGWRRVGPSGWWDAAETTFDQKRALVLDLVRGVTVYPVGRGYRGDTTWGNTDILWTDKGQAAMDALAAQAERDAAEEAS